MVNTFNVHLSVSPDEYDALLDHAKSLGIPAERLVPGEIYDYATVSVDVRLFIRKNPLYRTCAIHDRTYTHNLVRMEEVI